MESNKKIDFAQLMADRDAISDDPASWAKANDALNKSIQENQQDWKAYRRKLDDEAYRRFNPEGATSAKEKESSKTPRPQSQQKSEPPQPSKEPSTVGGKQPEGKNSDTVPPPSVPAQASFDVEKKAEPSKSQNLATASTASHMKSQLQQERAQTLRSSPGTNLQQNPFVRPQGRPNEKQQNQEREEEYEDGGDEEDEEEDDENETGLPATSPMQQLQEAQQRMQQIQGSQMGNLKKGLAMAKAFNALKASTAEEAKPSQDIAKAAVKKAIPKAAMLIANGIGSALELGTGGVALIVTFFIRFITLGWYNIEMIYGGWIMKGKHLIVGPLTWDPIPMPFPKNKSGENSTMLTALVIMADFFVIIMVMMSLTLLMLPYILLGALVSWII